MICRRICTFAGGKEQQGKVLEVVIEPSQKMRKRYYDSVVSIGVVAKGHMGESQCQENKIGAIKPLSRLAKELNLAICCLLGNLATDATINPLQI